jgi:hypothetical protein
MGHDRKRKSKMPAEASRWLKKTLLDYPISIKQYSLLLSCPIRDHGEDELTHADVKSI